MGAHLTRFGKADNNSFAMFEGAHPRQQKVAVLFEVRITAKEKHKSSLPESRLVAAFPVDSLVVTKIGHKLTGSTLASDPLTSVSKHLGRRHNVFNLDSFCAEHVLRCTQCEVYTMQRVMRFKLTLP